MVGMKQTKDQPATETGPDAWPVLTHYLYAGTPLVAGAPTLCGDTLLLGLPGVEVTCPACKEMA